MDQDFEALRELNLKIAKAEEMGDKTFFEGHLASALAFRRADPAGTVVDRAAFLASVKESSPRPIEMESISLFGRKRALVTCVVTMKVDGAEKRFHNLRLFVRDQDQSWRLLAWANEATS